MGIHNSETSAVEGIETFLPHDGVIKLPIDERNMVTRGLMAGVKRTLGRVKTIGETAIVIAEVTPVNEVLRYGAFAAAQAATGNPIVAGTVLGLSTLAIEGGAAIATADLLDTNRGKTLSHWANKKFRKIVPERTKIHPVAEAGIAYLGGSAVVLMAKQTEDPTRTFEKNRRHGLFTAGWLSALLTAQGVLASNGISNPRPVEIGVAIAGTLGVAVGATVAKNKS